MNNLNKTIFESGIMPILFADTSDCAERVVSAIEQTQMPAVEILQRGDCAKEVLKKAVKLKKNSFIGAGTICTLESCKEMVSLGADFIVSPGYNPEMVDWCVKNNITIIPGISNSSEALMAANAALETVKAFPFNELGGTKYFEGISGPFPNLKFVATGCLCDYDLHLLSNHRIAAIGGVWMFQTETDHTVFSEKEIIKRINISIKIGKHYRYGW